MITFSKLGLHGRLGNQMFQYAATKAASLNSGAVFAIPIENHDLSNNFNLDCKYYSLNNNMHLINKLIGYSENAFCYENKFENIVDNTDMFGYFQTEKYFSKYKDLIKKDFSFKNNIYSNCINKLNSLKQNDNKSLVSVHIRRTDYVKLQNFHPLCTLEYYLEAMKVFPESVFLIFSDDIKWCKENIINKNIIYSENSSAIEDMCLMSLCDHNIIANSSFSWWSAWLNNNSNKLVVAPKKWFGPGYSDNNTGDLYCKNWIII